MTSNEKPFDRLKAIVAHLRDPKEGCPWDLEQTHKSLKPFLIEEAYEVLEAIDDAPHNLAEELGDVLLQVMLHSQLASERGDFTADDVAERLATKLVSRHPHVFGENKARSAADAEQSWERMKLKEKDAAAGSQKNKGIFDDIPKSFPALMRAFKIGKRSSRINFDWATAAEVMPQLEQELCELKELNLSDPKARDRVAEELGDLLFTASQLARKLELNAEEVLNKACDKFIGRVSEMEKLAGQRLDAVPRAELEKLWTKVKSLKASSKHNT